MDIELLLPAAVCRQTQARACMPGLWQIQVPWNKDTLHYLILQVRQAAHRLGLQLALLHHAELQMISGLTLALHTSTKGTGISTAATTHITAFSGWCDPRNEFRLPEQAHQEPWQHSERSTCRRNSSTALKSSWAVVSTTAESGQPKLQCSRSACRAATPPAPSPDPSSSGPTATAAAVICVGGYAGRLAAACSTSLG